jgi:hypothetical protein
MELKLICILWNLKLNPYAILSLKLNLHIKTQNISLIQALQLSIQVQSIFS